MKCEFKEKSPRFVHSSDSVYIKIPDNVEKIAFIYFTDEDKFLKIHYKNKVDSIKMEKGNGKILEIDTRNVKNFLLTTKYKLYPPDKRKIAFTIKGMIIYYEDGSEKFVEVDKFKNYIEIDGLHNPEGYFYKYKSNFVEILNALAGNWDASWYRNIAENGYRYDGNYKKQQNPQFFPLYPFLSKIFSIFIHLPIRISLLFINNLFSLLALIVIFKLTEKIYNKEISKKTIMLLSFYPGSISLTAGYSEGLNMFLISLALYFLLIKRNYFLSSILIGISTSVRAQSIFFSIGFLICLILFERKNIKIWEFFIYLLLSFSGVIFYSLYLFLKFKEPFAWYLLNRYAWGTPDFIKNFINSFRSLLKSFLLHKVFLPKYVSSIFTIFFTFLFLKFKEKTNLFIISLVVFILTIISIYTQTPSNLSCLTRLFITDFPLFIFLARFLKNDLAFSFILILFSIELLLFSLLFNHKIVSNVFPELVYIP